MKKVIITQSNYIPWKGFFDGIKLADVFVVYDDMQYTKRDWRNRNLIKTVNGLKWLTIPVEVKGKYFQKINETKVADSSWTTQHLDTIKQAYKSAACYNEMKEWLEDLYRNCNYSFLTDINLHFITKINTLLGISTTIKFSSEFILAEEKTERLVNICKEVEATDYYSGPAAKAYMNIDKFTACKLNVHYFDYTGYPEYPQLHGPFDHGVSIIDLILNTGSKSVNFLKF